MHSNQAAENGILDTTSTTFGGSTMTTRIKNRSAIFDTGRKLAVSALALGLALGSSAPAWATIDNTVTATGTGPSGPITPATADEEVDVIDAVDTIAVTKTASDDTDVAVGATVTYTYTATNTGNRTLTAVSMTDSAHEGSGSVSAVTLAGSPLTDVGTIGDSTDAGGDDVWDTLAPGDTITWTATYVITQADLNTNGGDGDGELTNTATAAATAPGGVADAVTASVDESVDLEAQVATLSVTKIADDDTDVIAGQTITYTYVVTNTGNVPITNVALSDNVTAGSGGNPTPTYSSLTNTSTNSVYTAGNIIDLLYMGDSATFTGTYVVTQSDVDNLQ